MSDKPEVMLIDAISRRAVLDRLEMLRRNYSLKAGYRDAMTDAIGEVSNALTIDAVPVVHGHWIKVLGGNGLVSTIRCSECDNCDNPSYIPGNYCWFCGAKMDGGKDDENA